MNKVEFYDAVGRIIDISKTRRQDIYLNGEFIGTYQPALYFRKGYENEPICCDCKGVAKLIMREETDNA